MKFELDGETWDSVFPASLPYNLEQELIQVSDKSASGITHVESFNVKTDRISVSFVDMEHPVYESLVNWFVSVSNGMEKEFTVTDDLGKVYDARFTSGKLNFKNIGVGQNGNQLWTGNFILEAVS